MIDVVCGCGKRYQVDDALAGGRGRCTSCGAMFDVPAFVPTIRRRAPWLAGAAVAVVVACLVLFRSWKTSHDMVDDRPAHAPDRPAVAPVPKLSDRERAFIAQYGTSEEWATTAGAPCTIGERDLAASVLAFDDTTMYDRFAPKLGKMTAFEMEDMQRYVAAGRIEAIPGGTPARVVGPYGDSGTEVIYTAGPRANYHAWLPRFFVRKP